MTAARRIAELAAARPAGAFADILGLAVMCGMVFAGFFLTAI